MMVTKTSPGPLWSDQPQFETFEELAQLTFGHMCVQIADVTWGSRKGVAVSTGTLFGSQTILTQDARDAFKALNILQSHIRRLEKSKNPSAVIPISATDHGWTWLPNRVAQHVPGANDATVSSEVGVCKS